MRLMAWLHTKQIATPLLFRHLHFAGPLLPWLTRFPPRLNKFARYARLQAHHGIQPCNLVHSISYRHGQETMPGDRAHDMSYILLNAPNLRSLTFGGRFLAPNVLLIALHVASRSLSSLTVHITDTVLVEAQHIGQLQRLECLDLYSYVDWSAAYIFWDMPRLKTLSWQGWIDDPSKPNCRGDLEFLRRCRFPVLRALHLKLLRESDPSHPETTSLLILLESYMKGGEMQEVAVFLLPSQLEVILPCLRCPTVNLGQTTLRPDIAHHLRPEVKALILGIGEDNINQLWPLLTALVNRTGTLGVEKIRIISFLEFLPKFTWSLEGNNPANISREVAEFLGRLVPFALRLRARGVHVIDDSGHSLLSPA
jgi:hypothetical protein